MFKATKPFKNTITGYDNEPSLRIGKKVPKDAVNLAYYYNPTATDAEKILSSDPPRMTIDHRIETQWLTKLDQASGPNGEEPSIDLFPKAIYYSDEEGYYGRLIRQDETVNWYPEKHINQRSLSRTEQFIVSNKGDEPKFKNYADADGYRGTLSIDTVSYEVTKTKDESKVEDIDYTINNFELNFAEIFGTYISPNDIDRYSTAPNAVTGQGNFWPAYIDVGATKLTANSNGANNDIVNYINRLSNNWEGTNETNVNSDQVLRTSKPTGVLHFDKLEVYPAQAPSSDYTPQQYSEYTVTFNTYPTLWNVTNTGVSANGDYSSKLSVGIYPLYGSYTASPNTPNGYTSINNFIGTLQGVYGVVQHQARWACSANKDILTVINELTASVNNNDDILITMQSLSFSVVNGLDFSTDDYSVDMLIDDDNYDIPSTITIASTINDLRRIINNDSASLENQAYFFFTVTYKIKFSKNQSADNNLLYNVIANYHSITLPDGTSSMKRSMVTNKKTPLEYMATCKYTGLLDKNWTDYDGIAFYKGSVTKGNAVGNQNADLDNEILMFPDEEGKLRQIVEGFDVDYLEETNRPTYNTTWRNYYRIEAEHVYITDVFKDDQPCFYKYRLKHPIYDYRGPDENGFYNGDAVQIYNNMFKDIPEDYKHNIKLSVAQWEEVKTYDQYNNETITKVPKNYYAELYTSFISSSTDTFKVVYNGYDNIDDNNIVENGIEEDIYNAPFMQQNIDYKMISVNKKARINVIQLIDYTPIIDTRNYVSFSWVVKATNIKNNKVFISQERYSSILNKEYSLPCEYSKFIDRAMIISPKLNGDSIYCSPKDLCLNDQAGYQSEDDNYEPMLNDQDDNFIYSVEIIDINSPGSVNIKCNPDGSGVITAETTLDTGFYDENKSSYTKKLNINNPYFAENGYIYKGYKVKCVDARTIKVNPPRTEGLLESWYPLIQFGHYSRILDQYGTHTKICYSMPEYDTQHFSSIFGEPFVDIENERATILNSHMIKVQCCPLHIVEPSIDKNTFVFNNKFYKVVKNIKTWEEAEKYCKQLGGHIVSPLSEEENNFLIDIAKEVGFSKELWIGINKTNSDIWKTAEDLNTEYTNWIENEPANEPTKLYSKMFLTGDGTTGKWITTTNDDNTFMDGFICELGSTISVFKQVGNERFKLNIKSVSFSDGIILLEEAISENDSIIVNYTYLEENFNYRGYWRSSFDFVRIDLNPNIYHTYNNPDYLPSEISPSKNLFNKVIYFFMKPSTEMVVNAKNGLFYNPNSYEVIPVTKTRLITRYSYETVSGTRTVTKHKITKREATVDVSKTRNVKKLVKDFIESDNLYNINGEEKIHSLNGTQNTIKGQWYNYQSANPESLIRNTNLRTDYFTVNEEYGNTIDVTLNLHYWYGFHIYATDSETNNDWKIIASVVNVTPTDIQPDDPVAQESPYGVNGVPQKYTIDLSDNGIKLTPGITYCIRFIIDTTFSYNTELMKYTIELNKDVPFHLGDLSESPYYKNIEEKYTETEPRIIMEDEEYEEEESYEETIEHEYEEEEEYIEYETVYDDDVEDETKVKYENDNCLYHKIDNPEPDSDKDIMIGSVYIRQNTSLHSTILTDARTRGGGILESISDSLRHELEPESDFYLDIGYYDGKPYQENGVIIVRLDNRLLKEFGGRFTTGDIENKVKRWLGLGIYPIIEFVDSYKKEDLPQYNLEIEDSYTNVFDITPEIMLECIYV